MTVKRPFLTSLAVLFAPLAANADGWNWWDGRPTPHQHISADQMGIAGLAVAAVIGVIGYLVLRRRVSE